MEWEITTFFASGKYSNIATISCTEYSDGVVIVSAETEQITQTQFERALRLHYPDHYLAALHQKRFYWQGRLCPNQ